MTLWINSHLFGFGSEFGKKCIYQLYVTQLQVTTVYDSTYIGGKTAYKVLAKSYLGYCKKNNTDDAYNTGDKQYTII